MARHKATGNSDQDILLFNTASATKVARLPHSRISDTSSCWSFFSAIGDLP